jgi:predicted nucleotidyltransferase
VKRPETTPEQQTPVAPIGFPPVTEERLQEVARRIVETFNPECIILFGSCASGEPTPDSDVDLLIVMEDGEHLAERRTAVCRLFRPRPFPMDILVYTPAEIQHALALRNTFILEAVERGGVLYARTG